jgi:hypothetical protein
LFLKPVSKNWFIKLFSKTKNQNTIKEALSS